MNRNISLDKFRGMLWGVVLGDVLGSAYEHSRKRPPIDVANPLIAKQWLYRSMHSDFTTVTPAGQATDDTEMTIATIRGILDNDFANAYLNWGITHCSFAGKNTRKYLYNITTLRGLNSRIERFHDEIANAESNGFLMRASPLVLLDDENSYYQSAEITGNYNENCRRMIREYVGALKPLVAPNGSLARIAMPTSRATREQVAERETKGWGECALFCCRDYISWAQSIAGRGHTFLDAIRRVISLGGDTDTNGCIVGAIVGANIGMHEMLRDENVRTNVNLILGCDAIRRKYVAGHHIEEMQPAYPARPEEYHPRCISGLIETIAQRWQLA